MRIYSATDVGQKRKMNQDYVFASADPVGNLPNLLLSRMEWEDIMQVIMRLLMRSGL